MTTLNIELGEQEINEKMKKLVDRFQNQIECISTGRASTKILDKILVESYGERVHISRVSTVSVQGNSSLSVQVWDKSLVKTVEKSIVDANLGVKTVADGQLIRVHIPPLSELRRKELVKILHKDLEDARISTRNIRREYIDFVKKQEKEHLISEDDRHIFEKKIQKITDDYIAKIDKIAENKEKEIMQI